MPTEERRLSFGRWLGKKRNFVLFGTLSVGVGGYILSIAFIGLHRVPDGFWILMFPLWLLGGYLWGIVMWHFWLIPLKERMRRRRLE